MEITPFINSRIFWDVDIDKLDFKAKASFIIERVFERGDVDDIRLCRKYYSSQLIEKALLNCKYLPLLRLHLASAVLDKPVTQFRCFTSRRSNPELLPY